MSEAKRPISDAFPAALRRDAEVVMGRLTADVRNSARELFSVRLGGEVLHVPERLYYQTGDCPRAGLSAPQSALADCLLSRSSNGYEREKALRNIVRLNHNWIVPYVIRLAGEYVIEILDAIHENADTLDPNVYGEFLADNADFFALTKQRMVSYWDCYYRWRYPTREAYVGSKLTTLFEDMVRRRSTLSAPD